MFLVDASLCFCFVGCFCSGFVTLLLPLRVVVMLFPQNIVSVGFFLFFLFKPVPLLLLFLLWWFCILILPHAYFVLGELCVFLMSSFFFFLFLCICVHLLPLHDKNCSTYKTLFHQNTHACKIGVFVAEVASLKPESRQGVKTSNFPNFAHGSG